MSHVDDEDLEQHVEQHEAVPGEPALGSSLRLVDPVAARVVAVSTVPLVVLSAIFMADRPRPDQFIYGRYNDAIVWPLIALGLVWIVQRARHGWCARDVMFATSITTATVVGGIGIDRLHGAEIRDDFGVRAMIAGLLAYVDDDGSLDVWTATWISASLFVGAMILIGIAARSRVARVPMLAATLAVAIGLLAIGLDRTDAVLDARLNGWTRSAAVIEVDALVPTGAPLAVKTVATADDPAVSFTTQRQRYQVYQFYLPDRTFLRDRGVDDDVGPFVFAPLADPDLVEAGAEVIWRDPSTRIGLWREPDR